MKQVLGTLMLQFISGEGCIICESCVPRLGKVAFGSSVDCFVGMKRVKKTCRYLDKNMIKM